MTKSVDKRVVEMQFDNKRFEDNVQTSTKSLDNLKRSLDLKGAARGLDDLSRAGRSFSLSNIAANVDMIANRFTTLGIIGVTAIQNITNSVLNLGKKMFRALTIDPITTGLQEYETKINAIQTILTNTADKGVTLDQVNKGLAELNEYADKTIYNFAEMTRNIGTFTAAGVELDKSIVAIKGIANLAAGSGSNAQQASVAMYQLSQALASGTVKLMDWNSVVNAGMGGQLFQKALEKTAEELGHGRNMAVSFRESLESGWITSEVLIKTLEKFANDENLVKAATQVKTFTQLFDTMKESVQSGWAVSWENIIGDKDEAAAMLTNISDAFNNLTGKSSDARNEMLKFWKDAGGRAALIQSFKNILEGIASIIKPITEAFREIFPPMTGKRLTELTKGFEEFTRKFKIGEETAAKIKSMFKGIFAMIDLFIEKTVVYVKAAAMIGESLAPIGGKILDLGAAIGGFLLRVTELIHTSGIFDATLEKLGQGLDALTNMIKGSDAGLSGFLSGLRNIAKGIADAFKTIGEGIAGMVGDFDIEKLTAIINGTIIGAVLLAVKKLIGSLTDITNVGKNLIEGIAGMLDGVRECLKAWQQQLQASILLKLAIAIGILAGSLFLLASIDSAKLATALTGLAVLIGELVGSLTLLGVFAATPGFKAMITVPVTLIGISIALLILAGALKKISELDPKGVVNGLFAVAALCTILVKTAQGLSKSTGSLIGVGIGLIFFSTALVILTKAIEKLVEIDPKGLVRALLAIGALGAGLVLFTKTVGKMGVINGAGFILLAIAMNVLVKAIQNLGAMDHEALIRGLIGLGVALAEIGVFATLVGNAKHIIATAISLTIISTAMLIFAKAISNMGNMPTEVIVKGLLTLAAALLIIGVAVKFMQTSLAGAAALLIIAAALNVLMIPLKVFGSMSLASIGKSLLMLAGVFLVLGAAGVVLTPIIPSLLALAGVIVLIGVGCLAAGAGILALAAGITALAAAGAAGAVAIVALITALAGTIPMVLKQLGEGLLAFAEVIGGGGTALASAFKAIALAILDALVSVIPKAVDTITLLLTSLLNKLIECGPQMLDAGITILVMFLKGLASRISEVISVVTLLMINIVKAVGDMVPQLVNAGFNMIVSFINGLAEAIAEGVPQVVDAIGNLVNAIIYAAKYALGIASPSSVFKEIGLDVIRGFIEGLKSKIKEVAEWAAKMGKSAIKAAKEAIDSDSPSKEFIKLGMYSSEGFAMGLRNFAHLAETEAKGVGRNAIAALKKSISKISNVVNGNIDTTVTIRPVLDLSNVTSGAKTIDSLISQSRGLAVENINSKALSINRNVQTLPTNTNELRLSKLEKLLGDLKDVMGKGEQRVTHDGEITVKGVNDMNELVGYTKVLAREINWDNRCIPKRVSILPSQA